MNTLYQVQLETKRITYSFEIATSEFNAIEIAKDHIFTKFNISGPFHIGRYSEIGQTEKFGITSYKITNYHKPPYREPR